MVKLPIKAEWAQKQQIRALNQALHDGNKNYLIDNYLYARPVEMNPTDGSNIFNWRKGISSYENDVRPHVRHWVDQLMQSPIVLRDDYSEEYSAFLRQVTGPAKMRNIKSYISEDFAKQIFIQGNPSILIDAPALPEGGISAEEEDKYLPRLTTLPANSIPYWEKDETGVYTVVHVESYKSEVNEQGVLESIAYRNIYVLEGANVRVMIYRKVKHSHNEWEFIEELPPIPQPFIPIFTLHIEDWLSSELTDRLVSLFNMRSQLDAGIAQLGFGQRFLVSNSSRKSVLDGSVHGIIRLEQGESFGQTDPVEPKSLESRIYQLEEAIKNIALRRVRTVAQDSRMVESAESQEAQREGMDASIETVTMALGPFISNVLEHVAYFHGDAWPPENQPIFAMTPAPKEDIAVLQRLASIPAAFPEEWLQSRTLRAEVLQRVLSSPDLDIDIEPAAEILVELGYGETTD